MSIKEITEKIFAVLLVRLIQIISAFKRLKSARVCSLPEFYVYIHKNLHVYVRISPPKFTRVYMCVY